jgi:uncharacterized protein YbbC (DUF1343 family)
MYQPVFVAIACIYAISKFSHDEFQFKQPPYEYEVIKMPFDILAGSSDLRQVLERKASIQGLPAMWESDMAAFKTLFKEIAHYPEN